ncbi:MAG: NAD(P)-dependent oxidoreductase [Chloroflexia bacterium]|nr:NAD(P)-dependent oxidoreductase [Chloroflexia bacterium]MDQ3411452.1 NAD(P)-dependent oxidoreductase [Chloroflexota bacterium]
MTESKRKRRVLLTGAEGTIGAVVREFLSDQYEIRSLTWQAEDFPSHVGDISDYEAIRPAFDDIDVVVHMAASSAIETPWEDILPNNLIGTYNVFEAARDAGVGAVVFASSNHAVGMFEVSGSPGLYELDDPRVYDHTVEIRPDSLYGVSKAYGEALGRFYMEQHGMRVVCLRIGAVRAGDDPYAPTIINTPRPLIEPLTPEQRRQRMRAMWMSRRDCAQLVSRSIEADDVPWAIVYGISNNPRQFWDLSHAREVLGFNPEDSAPV